MKDGLDMRQDLDTPIVLVSYISTRTENGKRKCDLSSIVDIGQTNWNALPRVIEKYCDLVVYFTYSDTTIPMSADVNRCTTCGWYALITGICSMTRDYRMTLSRHLVDSSRNVNIFDESQENAAVLLYKRD